MEFLLIGESKLKIVVNDEEMKLYKLDSYSSGDGAILRRSFWSLLDRAKADVGFDPAGDKVLIQFYPIKSGGCEIFVTKLGILPESSARLVSKSSRISMLSKKRSYYIFSSVENLISATRAIKNLTDGASVISDVYESDGKYYLSIEEYGKGGEPIEFPCILEFGEGLAADLGAYISEHAVCLANENGVDRFSTL